MEDRNTRQSQGERQRWAEGQEEEWGGGGRDGLGEAGDGGDEDEGVEAGPPQKTCPSQLSAPRPGYFDLVRLPHAPPDPTSLHRKSDCFLNSPFILFSKTTPLSNSMRAK